MFFIILGTYPRWTFIIFSLVQRILLLIFRCHTVTHGTDLRRSPPLRDGQGWPLPNLSEMHGGGGVTARTMNQDSRRKGEAT